MMLQFGISTFGDLGNLSPAERMKNLLEEARLADQLGFDVFAIGEHHRPDYLISSPAVVLAAIAAQTKSIRLSSAVTVLSSEDPIRVFQQFASLDLISGGRAEIMAGRGSFIESFGLFGYELQDYDSLFSEKLELLLAINGQEILNWKGGSHTNTVSGLGVYPRPLQERIPVWLAVGGTPASVVRAAKLKLPLVLAIIGGRWTQFGTLVQLYRDTWKKEGNEGPVPGLCINQHAYLAEDSQKAADEFYPVHHEVFARIGRERNWQPGGRAEFDAGLAPQGHLLVGSPQQVLDKLSNEQQFFRNSRFMIQASIGTLPHKQVLKSIELFGSYVMPELRKMAAGS